MTTDVTLIDAQVLNMYQHGLLLNTDETYHILNYYLAHGDISGYKRINEILKRSKISLKTFVGIIKRLIQIITYQVSKYKMDYDIYLYRGISSATKLNYVVGEIFCNDHFTSTTSNRQYAYWFSTNNKYNKYRYIYKIASNDNQVRVKHLEPIVHNIHTRHKLNGDAESRVMILYNESEFLFNPFTFFRVEQVTEVENDPELGSHTIVSLFAVYQYPYYLITDRENIKKDKWEAMYESTYNDIVKYYSTQGISQMGNDDEYIADIKKQYSIVRSIVGLDANRIDFSEYFEYYITGNTKFNIADADIGKHISKKDLTRTNYRKNMTYLKTIYHIDFSEYSYKIFNVFYEKLAQFNNIMLSAHQCVNFSTIQYYSKYNISNRDLITENVIPPIYQSDNITIKDLIFNQCFYNEFIYSKSNIGVINNIFEITESLSSTNRIHISIGAVVIIHYKRPVRILVNEASINRLLTNQQYSKLGDLIVCEPYLLTGRKQRVENDVTIIEYEVI